MEQLRDIISKGSSVDQLSHEVKALTKEDRQSLLDQVTVHDSTAIVSPNDVLAMKADLSIPWHKLRILRRYKPINYYTQTPFSYIPITDG